MNKHMQPNMENITTRALKALSKEYVAVGKTRVRSWHAWLVIGLCVGILTGILFVANRSGKFEVSKAAQICNTYFFDVPLQCYQDSIFGYEYCNPVGSYSGCYYDEYNEPYACWLNETYCYDDGTTTEPPPDVTSPEIADPMADISPVVFDDAIGVNLDPDVVLPDPVNLDGDWSDLGADFTVAAGTAADPFLGCTGCDAVQESATEDYVHNSFNEEEIAENQGDVTELKNEYELTDQEIAAILAAQKMAGDTGPAIDDARGYTDAELAEEKTREENDDAIVGASLADINNAMNNQPSVCTLTTRSPGIQIGNCGLSELELNDWANIIIVGGNNLPQELKTLVYNGTIPVFIFKNRGQFNQFASDVLYSIGGQRVSPANFGGHNGITMGPINSRIITAIMIFDPGAASHDIFTENNTHQNWPKKLFVFQHELMHAVMQYKFTSMEGGGDGVSISARNRNGAKYNVLTKGYVNGALVEQTVACVTLYSCYNDLEYWADTGSVYVFSNGSIVPKDTNFVSRYLYGSEAINFLISRGVVFQLSKPLLKGTSAPTQTDLQLDVTSYNHGGFDFRNLLAGLFSLIPSASGAVPVNETQIAFDKLQKMSDTLSNISNQSGLVAETQVTTAINAIVPGVDQWLDLEIPDSGAHRYWRFLDQGSAKKMQISEIAMSEFSIANLTPLLGIPIYFAPGKLPSATAIAKAFDKNTQNLVTLTPSIGTTYIGLDLGSAKNVRGVSLYNHLNTSTFNAKLQYSDDKINWTDANISANIPVASKNAANIFFANNVAPEAAKIKMRADGFSRLTPVYGETRDAFTTGKAPDGKSAMTKDFEALLKGALNAADARKETGFANQSQDKTVLPFTTLTEGLQYAATVISKHASLASAIVEQDILTSAVAGSKAKQMPEFKAIKDDTASIAAASKLIWTDAKNALTSATTANNEIKSILKTAPLTLKPQIQALADEAVVNLKNTTNSKNISSKYINRVRGYKASANNYYNTVVTLNTGISAQTRLVSAKSQTMMNREELLLNVANNQFVTALTNANNAVKNTSAATQRSLILKAATQVQATTKRLDGKFTSTSETLYTQYYNLAVASSDLATAKTTLKTSLDAWKLGADIVKARDLKTKAVADLELLKQAAENTKTNAQKVLNNLAAARALIGTP